MARARARAADPRIRINHAFEQLCSSQCLPRLATCDHAADSSRIATQETEICGQRLWARRAGNSRPYAPNRPQRPVLLAQATEMSGYFRPPEISSICADCLVGDAGNKSRTTPRCAVEFR